MNIKLQTAALVLMTAIYTHGQGMQPDAAETEHAPPPRQQVSETEQPVESDDRGASPDAPAKQLIEYKRPNAAQRLRHYANSVVGPLALTGYVSTAALLTWRDSPNEWGHKWEGFSDRTANLFGKSVIMNTTAYGLDEVLKVDSKFYLSRDRSVTARFRNSVFSAVTARNKNGKRVAGIPRIAGGFAAEVVASKTWYPSRFNLLHGLKGGAITVGVDVGFNLIREFVWKK